MASQPTEPARDTCSIEGCTRPVFARGWCGVHWKRWRNHGDVHYQPPTLLDRLMARIEVDPEGGCWLWTGAKARGGYGSIRLTGATAGMGLVHRVSYELHVGPVPEGKQLDHLCRVRHCCNPDHLEPVTAQENTRRGFGPGGLNARKTHCPQGHPLEGENLRVTQSGGRVCRTCEKASGPVKKRRQQKRFAAGLVDRPHGVRNTYVNFGCRCEACSQADREYKRQYLLNKRTSSSNQPRPAT